MDKSLFYQLFELINETPDIRCTSGRIIMLFLLNPLQHLKSLLADPSDDSKLLLHKKLKYISFFQITLVGTAYICDLTSHVQNSEATFKIHGLIYKNI